MAPTTIKLEPDGLAFEFDGPADGPFLGVDFDDCIGGYCRYVNVFFVFGEGDAHGDAGGFD